MDDAVGMFENGNERGSEDVFVDDRVADTRTRRDFGEDLEGTPLAQRECANLMRIVWMRLSAEELQSIQRDVDSGTLVANHA